MELTLIPLAVVLLLLSGAGTRVRLADAPSVSAGLIRLWLSREDEAESCQGTSAKDAAVRGPLPLAGLRKVSYRDAQESLGRWAQVRARRLRCVLLRGRFGVRSAAFASTAPPSL